MSEPAEEFAPGNRFRRRVAAGLHSDEEQAGGGGHVRAESGAVAHFYGAVVSVVSGGIGTLAIVLAWSGLFPNLRKVGRLTEQSA